MKLSKLFKRTLLIMVILFGLVANATSIFSGWMLYTHLTEEYQSKAVAIAKSIAGASVEIFLNRDAAAIQSIIDQYVKIPGLSYVLVAYRDGTIIAHTFVPVIPEDIRRLASGGEPGRGRQARLASGEAIVHEVGDYIDVSAPILAGQAGFVHVGMNMKAIKQSILGLFFEQQLITLVIFLVSVVAAYLMINRISKPLRELTDYAQRLAAHDFTARVDIQSDDEVGQLAATMTAMSRELAAHFSQLQRAVQGATADLQNALTYLSAVIESLAEGLMVLDEQGRVIQANPAAAQMFGVELSQLLGRSCRMLLGLGVGELLAGTNRAPAASGPRGALEITAHREDGESFPLALAVSQVEVQGRLNIIAILRDITERKRTEQALLQAREELEIRVAERTGELSAANQLLTQQVRERTQAEQALGQSQERFRSLSENAPDIIFTLGRGGAFTYVNPAWTRLLGHRPEQVLGRYFVDFVKAEEAAQCLKHIRRAIEDGQTMRDVSLSLIHEEGTPHIFSVSASPNLDSEGHVTGVVGILKDVTEHRRLEAQLQHAQKMEAVGTLAGGVAHEFNNILMTIKGYVQLMGMAGRLDPDHAEYLRRVDESCQRAAVLTTKMLTFSRMDVGDKSPVALNEMLAGVQQLLRQTLPPQIVLESDLLPDLPLVQANPAQIEQVILNLVLNARDSIAQAGVITLRSRVREVAAVGQELPPGRYVEITVQDTGQGMPPAVLERIFEPFFTTKEPGKGTGLGLSVAYSIVLSHGGLLSAESQLGRGSLFRVLLPVLRGQPPAEAKPPAPAPLPAGTGERVLVVDDEPHLRDIVRQALEAGGYLVNTAGQGQEALELYQQALDEGRAYDLVVLDLAMPVMDGEQCLHRLLELNPQARVIMATGHGGDQAGGELLRQRARAVLLKPFDLHTLLKTVRTVLAE